MPVTVLVQQKVADFAQWKPVFDSAFLFRKQCGEQAYKLFRDVKDPNDVTLVLEFSNVECAQKFIASETLRTEMQKAGVIGEPSVKYMSEFLLARRTAAD